MTYAQIAERLNVMLWGNSSYSSTVPRTQIMGWFDEVAQELARECGHIEDRYVIPAEANVGEYDLPEGYRELQRCTYNLKYMYPIRAIELRRVDSKYKERTGDPSFRYTDELNHQIKLYPTPTAGATYLSESYTPGRGALVALDSTTTPGRGAIVDVLSSAPPSSQPPRGVVVDLILSNQIEVFYKHTGDVEVGDDAEPPVPGWAWPIVLYGVLQRAYTADTKLQNIEASRFFGALYEDGKRRIRVRSNDRATAPEGRKEDSLPHKAAYDIRRRWPETIG